MQANSLSGALRPPRTALIGGASGSASIITAAPGPSSAAIPIIVVPGETAGGVALLGLHLVRGLMNKFRSKHKVKNIPQMSENAV